MASRKLPKRLFKSKDVVHSYQHDKENKLDMKSMSRDHLDVLQNIEFTLVRAAREDDDIDDRTIEEALQMAMRGVPPDDDADPLAVDLVSLLEGLRHVREDVTDSVWQAGLKQVRDSVRRHSDLAPGRKGYIRFVEPYLK